MHSTATETEIAEFSIGGQLFVGEFPLLPVRFLLQRKQRESFGYTLADIRAIAELKAGDPMIEPSEEADAFGLQSVYYAAVGLCHPSPKWPNLRSLRHDVYAYGEAVLDAMLREHATGLGAGRVTGDLINEGRRLLREMVASGTSALVEDLEVEKDFSEGRGEASISE